MRTTARWACVCAALVAAALSVGTGPADAQALNWDGQTGGLVTPSAALAPSSTGRIGRPVVAFSLLDAGEIVGRRFQISFTVGVAERAELGYTKSATSGDIEGLAAFFDRGFQNIHGKVRLVADDPSSGRPAVAVGGRFAWQRSSLTEAEPLRCGDVYLVVTKSVTAGEGVAVQVNGGVKLTNATLLSLGGNASDWKARAFGSGAVVVRERVTIGAELLQQVQEIEVFGTADIPPTFSVYGRIVPVPNRFSVLVAYVRLAGVVATGADLQALNRFAIGAAVGF